MTVSDAATRVSFAGNGSTTAFSFPHYFPVNGDLTVIKRSSTGVETIQTITTHYTVSGAGNPSGGTVTMVTAPASGETLVILRELDETQELALTDNDSFAADSFELALDRTVLMIQQLNYDLSRAIKMPRTDSSSLSMALPSSIDRANKAIVFDANGNVDVSDDDYNDQAADAAASATAAASSASAASTSATNAASSASSASTSASSASTSASNASASASSASTSATSAATSATNASTSATSAATSATNAAAQATGLRWNFDNSTIMSDPGTGDLRMNNATIASVTAIAVSANSADTGNPDVSDFVVTWDDSTNTNRGTLTLRKIGTPATFATFTVTGSVTDSSTFLQLSVSHVASSGTLSDGDQLIAQFSRSGDQGVDFATGAEMITGTSTTKAGNPANTKSLLQALPYAVNEAKGANIASATTTTIWATDGNLVHITGTTTITSFGTAAQAGAERTLIFDGVLTLTHNATSLVLPGGANITTAAGDRAIVRADTTANAHVIAYVKASGTPVIDTAIKQGLHTIYIPASAMTARTTNGAATGTTELTTNKNMLASLDFDATTQEFAQFEIAMPKSWNEGTITFDPVWTAASGSGGVVWALQAIATSNDDAMDVAFGTEQTSTDTLITANDCHVGPTSSAITVGGSPAASDRVQFQIKRNVSDGSDTLAVDAKLLGVRIFYTIDAATDA